MTMAPYEPFIEGHMSLTGWSTNKLKRVAQSSWGAEIHQECNTDDEVFAAIFLWSELNSCTVTKHNETDAVKGTPGIAVLDAKGGVCSSVKRAHRRGRQPKNWSLVHRLHCAIISPGLASSVPWFEALLWFNDAWHFRRSWLAPKNRWAPSQGLGGTDFY